MYDSGTGGGDFGRGGMGGINMGLRGGEVRGLGGLLKLVGLGGSLGLVGLGGTRRLVWLEGLDEEIELWKLNGGLDEQNVSKGLKDWGEMGDPACGLWRRLRERRRESPDGVMPTGSRLSTGLE
jgi:hypothetical protein